jgi:DNA-binding MarR family transcriptional regulator
MTMVANRSAHQKLSKKPQRAPAALSSTLAFMQLLWAVDHSLRSISKQMQAAIGLTGPQRLVLRILGRLSPVMPSELADLLHLDRSTVSGVLDRLSEQQLLVRRRHPEDGRSVLVALSTRGKLLDRETAGTIEVCVQRALASLPRSKIEAAMSVLGALARELAEEERRMSQARTEGRRR